MHDYKLKENHTPSPRLRFTGLHWLLLGVSIAVLASSTILIPNSAEATRPEKIIVAKKHTALEPDGIQPLETTLPLIPPTGRDLNTRLTTHHIKIKSGDSLSRIFSRYGLSAQQLHFISNLDQATSRLADLRPGQKLLLKLDENKQIHELTYEIDSRNSLHISRRGGMYLASLINREYKTSITSATGKINQSLYIDAQNAGLSDNLIMELVGIFGWDIDFALDIRKGDNFSILFEEHYLDGKKVRSGNILAAEFTSQGNTYQAVRYTDSKGHTDYYSPDGRSMRKAFLRTPVDFKRISSRFGKRKHPVLNRMRAHKGVDYAASSGTPIRSTGNGKIIFRGKKGGYGNTIVIRHGGKYSTLYAHMKSFRKGLRTGSSVRQGDIIGFVGKSGLATGPHLHYEFRVNGVHKNPLTVRLPAAEPINTAYKKEFQKTAKQLLAQLKQSAETTQVAKLP